MSLVNRPFLRRHPLPRSHDRACSRDGIVCQGGENACQGRENGCLSQNREGRWREPGGWSQNREGRWHGTGCAHRETGCLRDDPGC